MVANAGISGGGPFLDTDTKAWDRQISINLRGTMLCYKYAGQQMVKQKRGGRIVGEAYHSLLPISLPHAVSYRCFLYTWQTCRTVPRCLLR